MLTCRASVKTGLKIIITDRRISGHPRNIFLLLGEMNIRFVHQRDSARRWMRIVWLQQRFLLGSELGSVQKLKRCMALLWAHQKLPSQNNILSKTTNRRNTHIWLPGLAIVLLSAIPHLVSEIKYLRHWTCMSYRATSGSCWVHSLEILHAEQTSRTGGRSSSK